MDFWEWMNALPPQPFRNGHLIILMLMFVIACISAHYNGKIQSRIRRK